VSSFPYALDQTFRNPSNLFRPQSNFRELTKPLNKNVKPPEREVFYYLTQQKMKYFLFPVQIDPTKPLNPSHIRHLLYVDFLYKMRKACNVDVDYLYNRLAFDVDNQVIKLGEYLRGRENSDLSDGISVGKAYIEMSSRNYSISEERMQTRRQELESSLAGHEYYKYILPEWKSQYKLLGMYDPGLYTPEKFLITHEELLRELKKLDVVLDARSSDGNIYLDFSNYGLRLRKISSANVFGYNYMFIALRRLVPVVNPGDMMELVFDPECTSDFLTIGRVLEKLGCTVICRPTARVAIQGKVASARKGGWEGHTLTDIVRQFEPRYTPEIISLGLRLYLLVYNSQKVVLNFSYDELQKSINKAVRIQEEYGTCDVTELASLEEQSKNPELISSMQVWYRTLKPKARINSNVKFL